jgi:hypothetical protein
MLQAFNVRDTQHDDGVDKYASMHTQSHEHFVGSALLRVPMTFVVLVS